MWLSFKFFWLAAFLFAAQTWATPSANQIEFFEKHIRPALAEHCYECHNSGGKAKGDLALDWKGGIIEGGASGDLIVPGKPDQSLLIRVITYEEKDLKMPKGGARFSPELVQYFKKWITMGAPDPRINKPTKEQIAKATSWETIREKREKWWSFQPIQASAPPEVKGDWAESNLDKFIQAKWENNILQPAPDAKPEDLIRRLSFTLIGLPPTPAESTAFLKAAANNRNNAIKQTVERLIASPHFGERWARHWMDWVRYAESLGSEGDPRIPHAAQYRNYLIRAFNQDIPYNQLLREHIAGDLLAKPRINEALGLNESAIGPAHYRFFLQGFAPTDALDELVRTSEDQIDVVSKAFLGMTVSCARCHNHKFDAISQRDYHAFYSIMTSTRPATINVDSPARQNLHKTQIQQLKGEILSVLAKQWLEEADKFPDRLMLPDARLQKAINNAKGKENPLHAWQQLRKTRGNDFIRGWNRLAKDFNSSAKRLDQQNNRPYAQHWKFNRGGASKWIQNGNGLNGKTANSGSFRILSKGEQIVEDILPAGIYSHLLSAKHTGWLGSPRFRIGPNESIWVRVRGTENAMARYVVQNYTRSGTVYPTTRLNDNKWRWQQWSLKYWEGDDAHLEVTTAGEQAVLTSDGANSWFGVTEALVLKPGQPSPREEAALNVSPLFTVGSPKNTEGLSKLYAKALRETINAWKQKTMNDFQANFLGYFIRENLLSNTLASAPKAAKLTADYRKLEAEISLPQRAPGVVEGDAQDMPLYIRGSHKQPGETVPRRFLEAFDPKPFNTEQSGRLELSNAMLRPDNPLVARVIVNRIWHHIFGQGLVATPDNFGKLGTKPSHPKLLDYLATRFVKEGWSIKQLIRELTLTRTFQLSAATTPTMQESDPDNTLLTRAHLRRLDAESIRDAMLQASGALDRNPYGGSDAFNTNRRSIYVRVIRNNLDPFLNVFDQPVPATVTGRRDKTNVPSQSLTMMNSPFVVTLAERLAKRIQNNVALTDQQARIKYLFQLTLNRTPTITESNRAKSFLNTTGDQRQIAQEKIRAIKSQIKAVNFKIASLTGPTRKQLLDSRKKNNSRTTPIGPKPFAAWNFAEGTKDQMGKMDLSLQGKAKIQNGALILNGQNAFARSKPITKNITSKTLEAWVELNKLNERGGGVISLQTRSGVLFDAIVFGEQQAGHWMAGSNNFKRTRSFGGTEEKEATKKPVHIAIVYASDGTITGYRDGKPYGRPYKADIQNFIAGESEIVIGLRHGTSAGKSHMLSGKILKAHLYDRALNAEEILVSGSGNPNYISKKELLANLQKKQREELEELSKSLSKLNEQIRTLEKVGATAPDPWRDLAQAMFNLKEFIYLQ